MLDIFKCFNAKDITYEVILCQHTTPVQIVQVSTL